MVTITMYLFPVHSSPHPTSPQLRQWGWMHHLARHSVACFLTRGDLYGERRHGECNDCIYLHSL